MNILLVAYKIEPGKGSEDGTGYHLVKALLNKGRNITLITRPNNIDKLKADDDFANVEIIGVDVPSWIGFFKNKERGIILYYYLWQIFVGLKVRSLQKKKSFDIIHQLNFHATWAPHFLFSDKAKLVWGPITHHAKVPRPLWFGSSGSYFRQEKLKTWAKNIFWHIDPFLLWAVRRSKAILYSAQTAVWPYSHHLEKLHRMTYAGSAFPVFNDRPIKGRFNILFVGRFVNLKGCMLAITAVKEFVHHLSNEDRKHVSVTIIGDGDLYADVAAAAQILMSATGVYTEVLDWQEQKNLIDYYQSASVFIYPSFEGQGLVVAEALTQGCPILCFEHTGPHDIAGIAAVTVSSKGTIVEVVSRLATKLQKLYEEFKTQPVEYAKRTDVSIARGRELNWSHTVDKILEVYRA